MNISDNRIILVLGLLVVCYTGIQAKSMVGTDLHPEVWVDDDFGPSTPGWGITHFDKIQDGVDAVDEGGRVNVAGGFYHEQVTISNALELIGDSGDLPVMVIPQGLTAVAVHTDETTIEYLSSVSVTGEWATTGVALHGNNNRVAHCIFHDISYGIKIFSAKSNVIDQCTISLCDWSGIELAEYSEYNTLSENTISDGNPRSGFPSPCSLPRRKKVLHLCGR